MRELASLTACCGRNLHLCIDLASDPAQDQAIRQFALLPDSSAGLSAQYGACYEARIIS